MLFLSIRITQAHCLQSPQSPTSDLVSQPTWLVVKPECGSITACIPLYFTLSWTLLSYSVESIDSSECLQYMTKRLSMLAQALAEGSGAHTKMGTWAVDEREAELCELIADQDERWDEAIVGKEQWINKPAQPPGLLRTGQSMLHLYLLGSPAITWAAWLNTWLLTKLTLKGVVFSFLSITGSSVQPAWPPEFVHSFICSLLSLQPARLLVVG